MDEFDNIVNEIADAWGIRRHLVLDKLRHRKAHGCLSYIIKEYYPHLMMVMMKEAECKRDDIIQEAEVVASLYPTDKVLYVILRDILDKLNLIMRKKPSRSKPKSEGISTTKRLFGFDFTEEDELNFKRIREEAPAFWKKMEKTGRPMTREY